VVWIVVITAGMGGLAMGTWSSQQVTIPPIQGPPPIDRTQNIDETQTSDDSTQRK